MPRRGSYLLLLVQKKVTQEKDTPFTALRVPCVARHTGRLRDSPDPLRGHALKQRLAEFPGMAVLLGGAEGPRKTESTPVKHQRFMV